MTAATVIAFDYSGTLSAGAVDFGRDAPLQAALKRSGLAALGVDTPAVYWRRVVRPTWPAASVTARPFSHYIVERVLRLAPPGTPPAAVAAAAGRFVERYLAASTIAVPWGTLVQRLCRRSDVRVIVATDHYLEATGAIIGHLAALGVPGAPLAAGQSAPCDVRVANSADLGCRKTDPAYWRKVASAVGGAPAAVILVDDFGAGEAAASGYAARRAAVRRKRLTTQALRGAGRWSVRVYALAPCEGDPSALFAAAAAVGDVIRETLDAR